MNFQELHSCFVGYLQDRIRSGEFTERGLARASGVSQPHLHHVLKGTRLLSAAKADRVLRYLKVDLLDLIARADLLEWRIRH